VNAVQEMILDDQILQSFPHIIRNFGIDGKREENGQNIMMFWKITKPLGCGI
jgi:hypothetical protein